MSSKLSLVLVHGLLCLFSIVNTTPILPTSFEQITQSDPPVPDDLLSTFHSIIVETINQSKLDNFEPDEGTAEATLSPEITSEKPAQVFEHENVAREAYDFEEELEELSYLEPEKRRKLEKSKTRLTFVLQDGPYEGSKRKSSVRRNIGALFDDKTGNPGVGYDDYHGGGSRGEKKHFLFDNKIGSESFQLFNKNRPNNKGHFLFDNNVGGEEKLNLAGSDSAGSRTYNSFYI